MQELSLKSGGGGGRNFGRGRNLGRVRYYNNNTHYLANEPFGRNWRILIWRLRRGYYSNDIASTGKL